MKKLLAIGLMSLFFSLFGCQGSDQNTAASQADTEEEYLEWSGPGWYYGRWFYVESDYAAWRRQRRRYYRRNYYHNQHYHHHSQPPPQGGHHGGHHH